MDMSRTALPPNLKRALAAALFCLCSATLAAPENPSSAPAERLYSVAEFNRLGAGVHWVEAYLVALRGPQCEPGGECVSLLALISSAPRSPCENGKIDALMEASLRGPKNDWAKRVEIAQNELNQACPGHAFRLLDMSWETGRKLDREPENRQNGRLRFHLRIRTEGDSGTLPFGHFAILEDFCAKADCEKSQGKGN
jgi:hypothetical protein